jgi:hypothetical protein
MSVDAERLLNLLGSFHELLSMSGQIGLALYLLYTQAGDAAGAQNSPRAAHATGQRTVAAAPLALPSPAPPSPSVRPYTLCFYPRPLPPLRLLYSSSTPSPTPPSSSTCTFRLGAHRLPGGPGRGAAATAAQPRAGGPHPGRLQAAHERKGEDAGSSRCSRRGRSTGWAAAPDGPQHRMGRSTGWALHNLHEQRSDRTACLPCHVRGPRAHGSTLPALPPCHFGSTLPALLVLTVCHVSPSSPPWPPQGPCGLTHPTRPTAPDPAQPLPNPALQDARVGLMGELLRGVRAVKAQPVWEGLFTAQVRAGLPCACAALPPTACLPGPPLAATASISTCAVALPQPNRG